MDGDVRCGFLGLVSRSFRQQSRIQLQMIDSVEPNRRIRMSVPLANLIRRVREIEWTPNRVWVAIFACWLFLLTGVTQRIGFGSPGALQLWSLNELLHTRQDQLAETDAEIAKLEEESVSLEKSRAVQEHEIRKTMGYIGENELIFDFSLSQSAALRRAP
jgi:cell division protein FtsB